MDQQVLEVPESEQITSSSLHAEAKDIAASLAQSVGAIACHLMLVETPHSPPLLVTNGAIQPDVAELEEILAWLQQIHERSQPLQLMLGRQPALVLPLDGHKPSIGAVLLCYSANTVIHVTRALAATKLAASALGAALRIKTLENRAVAIEHQTRLWEIQVNRNLIRGIIDSIPLGLALLNADGRLLTINRSLAERLECDPILLVGANYRTYLGHWEDAPAAHTFRTGVGERVQRSHTKADGSTIVLEIASFPLFDTDGLPYQVVEVWEDITQRVSLQTQLVRAEKLAAIGHLAASIAHEIGNPLQAIQGFLSLFLEQCPPEVLNRNFLELAEGEIERIVEVIARLRDLYRPRLETSEPVNANALVENVLLLTSKQLERVRIRVVREFDPDVPAIEAVANKLKQVLLNLVLNAIEAMREGGLLHVQTSVRTTRVEGTMVVIAITDTGVGIPPDHISHVFNGLHTTKERGMGLGLYTSKTIIEEHKGCLTVQSVIGEGTTFTIALPVQ